ncbi:MAG: AMP-binding protein [Solirubrobacterales bacterium]
MTPPSVPSHVKNVVDHAQMVRILAEAGVVRPMRPDKVARALDALRRWGASPAAGYAAAAARHPDRTAISDELGDVTFAELHDRSRRLASSLADRGISEGDGVAIMCRNHRGFIETVVACSHLGANVLFMNTMFSKPQLTEVTEREAPSAMVYDEEFTELLDDIDDLPKFVAWHDGEVSDPTLDELIDSGSPDGVGSPDEPSGFTILTSGTTGTPKGAQRSGPSGLQPAAALLQKIPLKAGETTHIACPLFHSWGFAHFMLGMLLGSTLVLRRGFDPEQSLQAIVDHDADALIVVPVMMQRILGLDDDVIDGYDISSRLKVTAVSGSALTGKIDIRWMDTFGDNLYNLYGSTEVAWATIAQPSDLRAAPGNAGKVPIGTTVRIVDEDGNDVEHGETGQIFVGNSMSFEGYTGGEESKDTLDDLISSGDLGHFDDEQRLHIDGRDDEMIVSGGENVFPQELEDLLGERDEVDEVAVMGVDDEDWGQRLKAVVVLNEGEELSADDVKQIVKDNLASYKVPRDVEFIDELPRNATGKVLKNELTDDEDGGDA